MIINLKLTYAYGKYSNTIATLTEGEVVNIKLTGEKHLRGLNYFAIIACGTQKKIEQITESGIFTLPVSMTDESGSIDVVIQARDKTGKIINEYTCESLIIKQVDGVFQPIPQIQNMENEIAQIKTALKEIYDIIKNKGDLGL